MKLAAVCAILVALAAARAALSQPAASDTATTLAREAPTLAAQVARGELPPITERLPENPMRVEVVERLGDYGGTWRTYHIGTDLLYRRLEMDYYGLTRWSPDASTVLPGLAESWHYLDGGRTIEFRLRKGLRWSDGHPFTTSDLVFWWKTVCDERQFSRPPEWAYRDGERMKVTALDAQTIRFTFCKPFYFVEMFTGTGCWTPESMIIPEHYLRQFHPDHNPEYTDFKEFQRRNQVFNNPDRPTMAPWRLSEYSATGDLAAYERNAYYWGVDPEGRQLPYIDRIESYRVRDSEAGALMVLSGDIDAQFRGLSQKDFALLNRFAERSNYRILRWEEGTAAWYSICINWSSPDPKRRALFRDRRFRRALAVAINREKIQQIVWNGLGRCQAGAITDEAWHFRSPRGQEILKRWRTEWSQFDRVLANKLLDECGLTTRGPDGFRRMPDGSPLQIVIECWNDDVSVEEGTLISQDFRAVGLDAIGHRNTGAGLWPRVQAGQVDFYTQHNSEMDLFSFPAWVFPTANLDWHPVIGRWHMTGGKEGEAPEGFMKELLDIYERCKEEPDLAKRHDLVLDAIEIHLREGPFFLGTVGRQPDIVVAKNDMRNIPPTGVLGPLAICQPGAAFPEQFFFVNGRAGPKGAAR